MSPSNVVRWNTYCFASIGKTKGGAGYCITHRGEFICCMAVDSAGTITLLARTPVENEESKEQLEIATLLFKELIEKGELNK